MECSSSNLLGKILSKYQKTFAPVNVFVAPWKFDRDFDCFNSGSSQCYLQINDSSNGQWWM